MKDALDDSDEFVLFQTSMPKNRPVAVKRGKPEGLIK